MNRRVLMAKDRTAIIGIICWLLNVPPPVLHHICCRRVHSPGAGADGYSNKGSGVTVRVTGRLTHTLDEGRWRFWKLIGKAEPAM